MVDFIVNMFGDMHRSFVYGSRLVARSSRYALLFSGKWLLRRFRLFLQASIIMNIGINKSISAPGCMS